MELLGANEPECSVGCSSRIKSAKFKERFSNEKCSAQDETTLKTVPYWFGRSARREAKLGSICKSANEGSFPPSICPIKVFSLDNQALENGVLYPLSLSGLNSQGVSVAATKKLANSNGFYDCDKIETTSEKAVGYGRPRSLSQPVELSLRCKRVHGGEKMNRENCSTMKTEYLKGITWSNSLYSPMAKRGISVRQKMNGCDQNLSVFTPRLTISKHEEIPHESHIAGPFRRSPSLNSKKNNTVPSHGIPPMHCEPYGRHEMMPRNGVYKEKSPIVNGWQQYPDFASREFLEDEPNHVGLRISELLERDSSFASEVARDTSSAWTLNDQHTRKGRANPGVIGGEIAERRRRGTDESPVDLRRNVQPGFENRPRKEARGNELVRPRTRSSGHGSTSPPIDGFSKFCFICRTYLVSEAQVEEHLKNTRHLNKLAKYNAVPYKKFCDYCKVHLNSESQANEHFSSGRHEQTVAKSQKAPIQQHLPLITTPEFFSPITSTSTEPLGYQLELYCKAMESNGVCFLPTGTGKELVASLVIAHMLQLNPSRQVVFLVDRVLLVLQQSDYLRKELGHLRVPDVPIPGKDSPPLRSFNRQRPIRIGAVCGEMRKLEGNARIYEQDVLIITADCYRNHLNNGTLRFEDVSLVVLDDAHHCNKDHPYNVIIRDFYLREDAVLGHRPKILGLTASLAGESSLDKTTKRLQRLLGNLGGARLMIVEENIDELQKKTTVASPVCVPVAFTRSERELMEILMEYLTKAFNAGVRMSELKEYKDIFQPSSGGLFSTDDIFPVLRVIDNILLQSRPESNALSSLLHFQLLCEAVCTLQECGASVALDQLVELATEGCPHGFEWAENMGLPCNRIKSYLEQHLTTDVSCFDSGVRELMEQLLAINWTGPSGLATRVALVLVKRSRTAQCLAKYLSSCTELLVRGIRTACIVGYGARLGDEGVDAGQKDTIRQIRTGCFQVVVTTTLAEDSLELPMCDLVIQMDPPNSVAAVEQMRSGVLQRQARSLTISRNDEQARKIDDLLKREENMQISSRLVNGV